MIKLFKFSKMDINKIANLASSTLWFSALEDFNDPFEGGVQATVENASADNLNKALEKIISNLEYKGDIEIQSLEYAETYSEDEADKIIKFLLDTFENELIEIKKLAACSFMEASEYVLFDQHMWSHYADGLRGYCICFDKKKLTNSLAVNNDKYLAAVNVKYANSYPSVNIIDYFCSFDNPYENPLLTQSIMPKLKAYFIVSTKSKSWENEKELRLLSGEKGGLFYSSDSIQEVVIGEKMPPDQQKLMINLIRSVAPNAVIRKAVMEEHSYGLKIIDYIDE
ncbi:DUF2971 domain-containing protein [Pantoea allii]|uniref:DUF2971 domain-containing protein n=1 Tax=Pantoea allii TaxID=574096 RepID=UPI0024B876DB|nr:DUF2971 domain-containing protein [Pantoea allii]MDJ0036643.1 DUF2971 domain-containing protein [Pantoea allii]